MTSPATQLPATADAMRRLVADGAVLPGDCVLYEYATPGMVQMFIGRVQRRALRDLVGIPQDTLPCAVDPDPLLPIGPHQLTAWRYTHAGLVCDRWLTVEQTSPRVRRLLWDRRLEGVRSAVVVRPLAAASPSEALLRSQLRQAAVEGVEDELHGVRYPYRELLLYYAWSWGWRKLGQGRRFEQVFRSGDRNVCSGAVIDWWQRAGVPLGLAGLDAYPEAWYPARLLVDPRFQIVAVLGGASRSMSPMGPMSPMPIPISGDQSNNTPTGVSPGAARAASRQPHHTQTLLSPVPVLPLPAAPASGADGASRQAAGSPLFPAGGPSSFLFSDALSSSSSSLLLQASGGASKPVARASCQ